MGHLAIICVGENPTEQWAEHHKSFSDRVVVVQTEKQVCDELESAKQEGYIWGVVLDRTEWIIGDVIGELSNSSADVVIVCRIAEAYEKTFVRLSIPTRYERGVMLPKSYRGEHEGCSVTNTNNVFLCADAKDFNVEFRGKIDSGNCAVVFPFHCIPERRLREHFEWNDVVYRKLGVSVFVVADREYEVPEYARCLVCPAPMAVFNLGASCNFGIRFAIDCGCDVIVKMDADIVFPEGTLSRMLMVGDNEACVPVHLYTSKSSYNQRMDGSIRNTCGQGSISMVSRNWIRVHYNENLSGYGGDDWAVRWWMEREGILMSALGGMQLWHIQHSEKRSFNPDNVVANMAFVQKNGAEDKRRDWGLVGWDGKTYVIDARGKDGEMREWLNRESALGRFAGKRVIVIANDPRGFNGDLRVRTKDIVHAV